LRFVIKQSILNKSKKSSPYLLVYATISGAVTLKRIGLKKNYYIVFLLISIACIAQKQEQGCLTVKAESETVIYNFDSIKDLEENMDSLLNEIDNTNDGLVRSFNRTSSKQHWSQKNHYSCRKKTMPCITNRSIAINILNIAVCQKIDYSHYNNGKTTKKGNEQ
jgi:hypothetical protein